ncbi:MAG: ATP synthase F1 subunit delta [Clostridiales bacterium]|jgi:F-type H+-transporting ATPase subunit delta|nr:ATP synthase F1 subunit delta [Clostridiales bacterium]
MGVLHSRYAQALLSLAESEREADELGAALSQFSRLLEGNSELREFMHNPLAAADARKDAARQIMAGGKNDGCGAGAGGGDSDSAGDGAGEAALRTLVKFVCLLIDKNRLPQIYGIAEQYVLLKSAARGELRATVYSRQSLPPEQLGALSEKYARRYGAASVCVENKIDGAILGGIIVQIGDVRIDDSLLGRLSGLRRAMQ